MKNYKTYNVGIYLRLSRDDGTNGESESIQNQKAFLIKYVSEKQFNLIDIYIDDGWSGTNFDRPAFKKMIEDIENEKINCVITKDLSRLGRDYIMTGHYIERFFPEHNVRYIAVNDNIDTFEKNSNNDMTPFKAVFNDMYAKDISRKVRAALNSKKENGLFIGGVPPYGYKKDPNNKNHLIIDDDTAPIVRRMFELYINGLSCNGIASKFTDEGIPTPSQSKNLKATQSERLKGRWNDVIVGRILSNQTYIGNLTQNRVEKINYKVKQRKNLPKSEWIIIENTHERIVDDETFWMVQELMGKRGYVSSRREPHLLSGLLKCGTCGSNMSFVSDRNNRTYAMCGTARKYYKLNLCTPHRIREDYVEGEIKKILRSMAEKYLAKDNIISSFNIEDLRYKTLMQEKDTLEKSLSEISRTITALYIDKTKNIVSESDFINISKELNIKRINLIKNIECLQDKIENIQNASKKDEVLQELLEHFLTFEELNHNMLATLINKVEVFEGKKIKITFNFKV